MESPPNVRRTARSLKLWKNDHYAIGSC
jgi:hypothetical protein